MQLRRRSTVLALLAAAGGLSFPVWAATPTPKQALTRDADQVLQWVVRSQDNQGLPFMIIDKRQAHLWVFDRAAQLQGDAPVLLGSARGDHSVPGIGDMPLSQIKPSDRTTPAGRFKAEVGKNLRGENVLWVDYDGGVSMHPVLTTEAAERRQERLATVMTLEQGKPLSESRGEIAYAASFLTWFAGEAERIYGMTIPAAYI